MFLYEINQIFFSNLILLGFDPHLMEKKYRIKFFREMLTLQNKLGLDEIVYFLFQRLDPINANIKFRECWPSANKKELFQFRRIVNKWLDEIRKTEEGKHLPRITSLYMISNVEVLCTYMFRFSTYVLHQVHNKEYSHARLTESRNCDKAVARAHHAFVRANQANYFKIKNLTDESRTKWHSIIRKLLHKCKSCKSIKNVDVDILHDTFNCNSSILDIRNYKKQPLSEDIKPRFDRILNLWLDLKGIAMKLVQNDLSYMCLLINFSSDDSIFDASFLKELNIQNILQVKNNELFNNDEIDIISFIKAWNISLKNVFQKLNYVNNPAIKIFMKEVDSLAMNCKKNLMETANIWHNICHLISNLQIKLHNENFQTNKTQNQDNFQLTSLDGLSINNTNDEMFDLSYSLNCLQNKAPNLLEIESSNCSMPSFSKNSKDSGLEITNSYLVKSDMISENAQPHAKVYLNKTSNKEQAADKHLINTNKFFTTLQYTNVIQNDVIIEDNISSSMHYIFNSYNFTNPINDDMGDLISYKLLEDMKSDDLRETKSQFNSPYCSDFHNLNHSQSCTFNDDVQQPQNSNVIDASIVKQLMDESIRSNDQDIDSPRTTQFTILSDPNLAINKEEDSSLLWDNLRRLSYELSNLNISRSPSIEQSPLKRLEDIEEVQTPIFTLNKTPLNLITKSVNKHLQNDIYKTSQNLIYCSRTNNKIYENSPHNTNISRFKIVNSPLIKFDTTAIKYLVTPKQNNNLEDTILKDPFSPFTSKSFSVYKKNHVISKDKLSSIKPSNILNYKNLNSQSKNDKSTASKSLLSTIQKIHKGKIMDCISPNNLNKQLDSITFQDLKSNSCLSNEIMLTNKTEILTGIALNNELDTENINIFNKSSSEVISQNIIFDEKFSPSPHFSLDTSFLHLSEENSDYEDPSFILDALNSSQF